MSAPFVWIITPAAIGVVLFFLRRWDRVTGLIAVAVCLWLAWVANVLPFAEVITLGNITLKISETYSILGRVFLLSEAERPFLAFLYLLSAYWLLGAYLSKPTTMFTPFAMITVALLTATLAVEPFLYAALMIETIVLFAVPLLVQPGQRSRKGVLRFLAFQTFGVPFILFTGWMLTGIEATPGNLDLVVRAGILLAIGFIFLLAVFPFHSWMPMVAEESQPYVSAFIFFMLPGVVSLFALGLVERFVWLQESLPLFDFLRVIGGLMVLVGGVMAAFEDHLGRMMGFAAVMETGWSMLAISFGNYLGTVLYFWLWIPRAVSMVAWAVSLSYFWREAKGDLHLESVRWRGRMFPVAVLGLLVSHFSLAGVPSMAGFPVRLALWEHLAGGHPAMAVISLVGSLGLMVAGMRTMLLLQPPPEGKTKVRDLFMEGYIDSDEPIQQEVRSRMIITWSVFALFLVVILWVGLFPQSFLPGLQSLVGMFPQLGAR